MSAAKAPFNDSFYGAVVTVIPIFFITLALELNSARPPILKRAVALYRYRKVRRFESVRERLRWFSHGLILGLTALVPVVTILGWAAEVAGLVALERRADGELIRTLVVAGTIALPTVTLFWAIVLRERQPTPLEEELDRLAELRIQAINELGETVSSMESDAMAGRQVDTQRAARAKRRLVALNRRNRRLDKETDKARRSLRELSSNEGTRMGRRIDPENPT